MLETLDEPVSVTILRDVRRVGMKLKHVLIPTDQSLNQSISHLRDWDLWGPLILCLLLALSLSFNRGGDQTAQVFAGVFVIVWCGAAIVTVNAALLGGQISFLQSVCVLGYCIAPLVASSLVTHFIPNALWFVSWIVVIVAFVWSTKASVGFMSALVPGEKRALGVYPVLLFYIAIAWLILVSTAD